MGIKQKLIDMGLKVWGLDLFIESYNSTLKKLKDAGKELPNDAKKLDFVLHVKNRSDRNGSVRIIIQPHNHGELE